MTFTESHVEQAALDWFQKLGYSHAFGPDLAVDGSHPERASYRAGISDRKIESRPGAHQSRHTRRCS